MAGEATAVVDAKPAGDAAAAVATPAAAAAAASTTPAATTPAAAAPAEIKLALPAKDAAIDQARVDELTAFAKANGLSQAAAEKLLERENTGAAASKAAQAAAFEAANTAALADAKTAWMAETKAAADLAGADGSKLVASKEIATKAVTKFGDADLNALLETTGFGEHPVVLRFLKRIGDALGEDKLNGGGNPPPAPIRDADLFYGAKKG